MTPSEEIAHLLKTHGAVLERKTKHKVWKFPDGRIFVQASTGSDSVCGERNALTELRKLLGIKRETHKNPERKAKKGVACQPYQSEPVPARPDWKQKLRIIAEQQPVFTPKLDCCPVRIERVPMTPLWCILRCTLGYGGENQRLQNSTD